MKNKLIILLIGCLAMLTGCKQTEYVYKTEYITKHERDSIYLRDSIFINQYMKGDTIFRDKEIFSIEYRDKVKLDTIFIRDSIKVVPVKHYVVKEKQKKTGWKYWIGCLTPIIIYAGYKLLKKYLRLR